MATPKKPTTKTKTPKAPPKAPVIPPGIPKAPPAPPRRSEWVKVARDLYIRRDAILFVQQYALDGTTIQLTEGKRFDIPAPIDLVLAGIDKGALV